MLMYITDMVIIGLQLLIIVLVGRWIQSLLEIKRSIEINKYKSWREVVKNAKEED